MARCPGIGCFPYIVTTGNLTATPSLPGPPGYQLRVRPGIPPLPSWRRRQRSAIRSIIRARLVCPGRFFVPVAVLVPALERAGRTLATYRRQLTTAHARDSSMIITPAAPR